MALHFLIFIFWKLLCNYYRKSIIKFKNIIFNKHINWELMKLLKTLITPIIIYYILTHHTINWCVMNHSIIVNVMIVNNTYYFFALFSFVSTVFHCIGIQCFFFFCFLVMIAMIKKKYIKHNFAAAFSFIILLFFVFFFVFFGISMGFNYFSLFLFNVDSNWWLLLNSWNIK